MALTFLDLTSITVERAALLLVLTLSREDEQELKQILERNGRFKCAVTELGAKTSVFTEKIISAVIGASLNCQVISKTPQHIHALVHATHEAVQSLLPNPFLTGDLGVKVGIVRDSQWIAVAMFGESADHTMSNHKRVGLGVMHMLY
ncbi:MAG TPA: HutP family protein [Clostridia bacterium]|nr:HutP family protein [Clostridia bacterium]